MELLPGGETSTIAIVFKHFCFLFGREASLRTGLVKSEPSQTAPPVTSGFAIWHLGCRLPSMRVKSGRLSQDRPREGLASDRPIVYNALTMLTVEVLQSRSDRLVRRTLSTDTTPMAIRTQYVYTREDLEALTGLTSAGISQHISRGNLDPTDLVSVAAFLARYGTEDVRLEIVRRMVGIDRQEAERTRPQSTRGIGRDEVGRVAEPAAKPGRSKKVRPLKYSVLPFESQNAAVAESKPSATNEQPATDHEPGVTGDALPRQVRPGDARATQSTLEVGRDAHGQGPADGASTKKHRGARK